MNTFSRKLIAIGLSAVFVAAGFSQCKAQIEYRSERTYTTYRTVSNQAGAVTRQRFLILGAVQNPGPYSFAPGTTVSEALTLAGGIRENADPIKIRIKRNGRDISYNLTKVMEEATADVALQAGDEIRVDEKRKRSGFQRFVDGAKYELKKAAPYIAAAAIAYVAARPGVLKIRRGHKVEAPMPSSASSGSPMVEVDSPAMAEMARTGGLVPVLRRPSPPIVNSPQIPPVMAQSRQLNPDQVNAIRQLLAARQAQQPALPSRGVPFNPNGGVDQLINRLNGMSQAEVNGLMGQGHWLDQFTPYWMKNSGGNPLAQFGVPSGLMGTLGTRDINKILDPNGLNGIQGKLKTAAVNGRINAGMAAQNRVYNSVQQRDYLLMAEKDKIEAMRRVYEQAIRTGVTTGLP